MTAWQVAGGVTGGAVTAAAGGVGRSTAERTGQRAGVPGYFYEETDWARACVADGVRIIVMNPASGPGRQAAAHYVTRTRAARASGIRVLGYVSTRWGRRAQRAVLTDIHRYRRWYGVTDVFLDESATAQDALGWYREVSQVVRRVPDALVVLNPGVPPDEAYLSVGDMVVVFEGTFDSYRSVRLPAWCAAHPPDRFWHLVHSVSARSLTDVVSRSRLLGAGTLYVTDQSGLNPWGRLPSYWDEELSAILAPDATDAAPGPSVGVVS